jgi:hypothetical protein
VKAFSLAVTKIEIMISLWLKEEHELGQWIQQLFFARANLKPCLGYKPYEPKDVQVLTD